MKQGDMEWFKWYGPQQWTIYEKETAINDDHGIWNRHIHIMPDLNMVVWHPPPAPKLEKSVQSLTKNLLKSVKFVWLIRWLRYIIITNEITQDT